MCLKRFFILCGYFLWWLSLSNALVVVSPITRSRFTTGRNLHVLHHVAAAAASPWTTTTTSVLRASTYEEEEIKAAILEDDSSETVNLLPVQDKSDIGMAMAGEEEEIEIDVSLGVVLAQEEEKEDSDGTVAVEEELLSAMTDIPSSLTTLPRHSHEGVNMILQETEGALQSLHAHSQTLEQKSRSSRRQPHDGNAQFFPSEERVFANSYVDFGKVDTVGFDYDYTLVTYTNELLELIYDMALKRLVLDKQYPMEMLEAGLKFDPRFSIRGLAVDRETGWICHLSYTHHVAVAWEGRHKVPTSRIFNEFRGKRALRPSERKKRLKPLNDLFSMAECCLIADTVEFFNSHNIPFCPRNAVADILKSVTETHVSGDFHRLVAAEPQRYFEATPRLQNLLDGLKRAGKRLIFVSNSPFWYVDAGMKYVIGPNWRQQWDVVITSAGKPNFYTDNERPFREVSHTTGRIKFKKVTSLETGEVYTEGCLKELTRLMDCSSDRDRDDDHTASNVFATGGGALGSHNVLYIGDSLFADLVDAKREFGWTTAAVTPEVGYEMEMQTQTEYVLAQRSIDLLLNALRMLQKELGSSERSEEDLTVLDNLERLVSKWRDLQTNMLGNPFGSIFRARYQPSLFAHSLRRYCDLYMSSVSSLLNYSPQHRFYPEDARLLGHELRGVETECWALEDVMNSSDSDE